MADREALKLALETLEEIADEVFSPYDNKLGGAILAIREVLAQPEQIPQRTWAGLTEAERVDIIDIEIDAPELEHYALAQSIEAALKEKNK